MELNMRSVLLGLLVLGLLHSGYSKPNPPTSNDYESDDDYQYDDDEEKKNSREKPEIESNNVSATPYFVTEQYTSSVKIGDTAILECNVKNFGESNLIMWYNQSTPISQSVVVISSDPRVTLDDKHSLHIADVVSTDQGQYRCLLLPNNIEMKANLQVQTRPQARIFRNDGRDVSDKSFTVHQGEQVELECRGTGRPEPVIKWSAEGERVTSGRGITVDGGKLTILAADHQHVRLYQCLADNGVSVAHSTITLNVQYSPKVATHRRIVNTIIGDTAELHCSYNTSTPGTIVWVRAGKELPTVNSKYSVTSEQRHASSHFRNTLLIRDVRADDLGEYTCEVSNSIGQSHSTIQLVLVPEPPKFVGVDISEEVVVSHWTIRSHQPLNEVQLNYRLNGTISWKSDKPIHHEKSKEHTAVWKIQHKLSLTPGVWHTQVKAKNAEGWSIYSEQYTIDVPKANNFDFFDPDERTEDITEKPSSANRSASHQLFSLACVSLVSATFFRRT